MKKHISVLIVLITMIKQIIKRWVPGKILLIIGLYKKNIRRNILIAKEVETIKNQNKFLSEKYGNVINKYKNAEIPEIVKDNYVVWVMWWQGEDQMPDIIKINYNSLINNANGHVIRLITKYNYLDFVEIPDYIIQKVELKKISLTHLSDILRVTILSELGGLWIDATIFVTSPLPKILNHTYWTPKWTLKASDNKTYPLWVGLWSVSSIPKLTITQCMGIWYSSRQNPIFNCLKDFWIEYWKEENTAPYYWSTELFLIGNMYDKIPAVKQMIDDVPVNNSHTFLMREFINKKYDELVFKQLISDTQFFYLSWKTPYLLHDPETGEDTLYHYFKKFNLINKSQ